MLQLISLSILTQQSSAQTNSTALEGWQLHDNSRSSWDILWTCLSTILACTWTAMHLDVPERGNSNAKIALKRLKFWILTTLAPELTLAFFAASEYWLARKIDRHFKSAQKELDKDEPHPTQEWSLAHGFCINMKGLVLRTGDNVFYVVRSIHVETLVKAKVVKSSDFTVQDIEDRAKADPFAKLFTVIQSTWVVFNTIARAAYHLPISPIEFATVAYVACAVISYSLWWHKPKDMGTPIVIHLPYDHDSEDMPRQLQSLLDVERMEWKEHPSNPVSEEGWVLWKIFVALCKKPIKTLEAIKETQLPEASFASAPAETYGIEKLPPYEEAIIDMVSMLTALVFCGIHIAAWNAIFPTEAERTAWRTFSLIAFCMCWPTYLATQLRYFRGWLALRKISGLPNYVDPSPPQSRPEVVVIPFSLSIYALARLGDLVLMFISLRDLPTGSYISIVWLDTIPHF